MNFKVQHPKAEFSTGGVPREKSFRECFAPLTLKIFKTSFYLKVETSSAPTPYGCRR